LAIVDRRRVPLPVETHNRRILAEVEVRLANWFKKIVPTVPVDREDLALIAGKAHNLDAVTRNEQAYHDDRHSYRNDSKHRNAWSREPQDRRVDYPADTNYLVGPTQSNALGESMEENNEILRYAQELSREIRPGRSEPDEVIWDDGLPLDVVIVRYGEVKLPSGMKGRLTPEDWRPLIASSIIYDQSLYRAHRRGSIVRLVLPLGVGEVPLIFALLQIFRMRSDQATIELILVLAGWVLFASSVLTLYIHWLWRSLFYAADRHAAEIVGTGTILESLRKTRDVISTVTVPRKRFSPLPGINQRVQSLEKLGLPSFASKAGS